MSGDAEPYAWDDPNKWEGQTQLQHAAEANDTARVVRLLASGTSVDETDALGRTALLYATRKGKLGAAQALLAAGADVNQRHPRLGTTPLIYAVRTGNVGLVETLLSAGAMVDAIDERGFTALRTACQYLWPRIIPILLEAGADTEQRNTRTTEEDLLGSTPLMYAARRGCAEGVEALLAGGANVKAVTHHGRTALSFACLARHEAIAYTLLQAGANVQDSLRTADHCSMELLKTLIAEGAVVDDVQTNESLLLSFALSNRVDAFDMVVAHGVDGAIGAGLPLFCASLWGHTEMVKKLVAAGADVNFQAHDGMTPLLVAAEYGHTDVIVVLLEGFADCDALRCGD